MFEGFAFGTPNQINSRYETGNIPVISTIYIIDIANVCTKAGKPTKLKEAKQNEGDMVLFHITSNSTSGDGSSRTIVPDPKGGWPRGGIGSTTTQGITNLVHAFAKYLMRKHAQAIQEWVEEQGYEIKFEEQSDPLLDEKIEFFKHAKLRWKLPHLTLDEAEDIRTELERFTAPPAMIEEATAHINRVRCKSGMGEETPFTMPEAYVE